MGVVLVHGTNMDRNLIHNVWTLAEDVFRPRSADADRADSFHPVRDNVRHLANAGFFGLQVPKKFGGFDADEPTRHEYAEVLASCCGVTAFTQQQLQTGVKFVVESTNEHLRSRLLPLVAEGSIKCGIALSHMRRSSPSAVQARRAPGGYNISGVIPWVSGWGLLDSFVLAATLENDDHIFAYVDMRQHAHCLAASDPMDLAVMRSSDTVEVSLNNLHIPDDSVLAIRKPNWLRDSERLTIASHAALPLGCARACVRSLRELSAIPGRDAVSGTAFELNMEIDQRRRDVLTWNCDCVDHPEYRVHALRARAASIVLATRAAHAVVVATGGRAHLNGSVAQRLVREASFYATAVQTSEVQASTLDQIFSPFFGQ